MRSSSLTEPAPRCRVSSGPRPASRTARPADRGAGSRGVESLRRGGAGRPRSVDAARRPSRWAGIAPRDPAPHPRGRPASARCDERPLVRCFLDSSGAARAVPTPQLHLERLSSPGYWVLGWMLGGRRPAVPRTADERIRRRVAPPPTVLPLALFRCTASLLLTVLAVRPNDCTLRAGSEKGKRGQQ